MARSSFEIFLGHTAWKRKTEAAVRLGSVTVWGWNGSSGSGFRFQRFLCKKRFFCVFQYSFNRKERFWFRFRFLENGSGGSGSAFGFGKNPVSPYPLNLGVTISPPKFRGRAPENTVKRGASDTPPPKFRGEMAPPKFRGMGLQGTVPTVPISGSGSVPEPP